MLPLESTTTINPGAVQEAIKEEACDFTKKNVCFIGNLSEDPLKTTLCKIGHCAYGTCGQESKKKLIDLITDVALGNRATLDNQFIQRLLIHEAQSAIAELESKAIVLTSFGHERYYEAIQKSVATPVLRPSPALATVLKKQESSSIGLIGMSFDFDRRFWNNFSEEHHIKVVLPEGVLAIRLSEALKQSVELNNQASKTELEQACSEQIEDLLAVPEPPSHILFCNIELDQVSKRLKHEKQEQAKFLSMSDVLRRLVVDFTPPDTKTPP